MRCYLCKGQEFDRRDGVVRDAPELQVLECRQCGLVALSSQEHIAAGHYEQSGMHGAAVPSLESWLNESAQDDQRRFEYLKASLVNRRVLDFGCGAGGFLDRARMICTDASGIEPEQRVRDHWNGKIRLFPDIASVREKFDVVTAFHVVEHLPDPKKMLGQLAGLLDAGGRLVIEVPSSNDALLTLYGNPAFRRFTYWSQHLFLFNAGTLDRLLDQAGLKVVSIQQCQRYPLSNHLHWLSAGLPGGHKKWSFLDTPALESAYAASLASIGKCDTLIAFAERRDSVA